MLDSVSIKYLLFFKIRLFKVHTLKINVECFDGILNIKNIILLFFEIENIVNTYSFVLIKYTKV